MPRTKDYKPYRFAFDVAATGLALASTTGIVLQANDAFCRILGYPSETELIGKSFRDLVHPDDVDKAATALNELLDGHRQSYEAERRYRRRDGSVVWITVGVGLVRDHRQRPWYFVVQAQDLTARHERDELAHRADLIRSHHQTAQALESDVLTGLRELRRTLTDNDRDAATRIQEAEAMVEDLSNSAQRLHRALLDEAKLTSQ